MFKCNTTESKTTPAKKTIKVSDILVGKMTFVDVEQGDITEQVLNEIPEGVTTVNFNMSFELPNELPNED